MVMAGYEFKAHAFSRGSIETSDGRQPSHAALPLPPPPTTTNNHIPSIHHRPHDDPVCLALITSPYNRHAGLTCAVRYLILLSRQGKVVGLSLSLPPSAFVLSKADSA